MLVKQVIYLLQQIGVFILMYFDVKCVQDSNVFNLSKNINKFSFFEISQKGKLLDLINALQTHIKMAFG